MNNQALKETYFHILRDYESLINEKYRGSNSHLASFSGMFLPSVHEHYPDSRLKVMLVGRETAGWTVVGKGKWATIDKYTNLADYINTSMSKHYLCLNEESVSGNEKGSTFFNFIKMLIPVVGREGFVWSNLFCFDLNKKNPESSPYFQTIKAMSKRLLTEQINTLNPDVIIFANGSASACYRAEYFPFKGDGKEIVCSKFSDPGKDSEIDNKHLWQFDLKLSGYHRCYRIHHPSYFSKKASNARDFLVRTILPEYLSAKKLEN